MSRVVGLMDEARAEKRDRDRRRAVLTKKRALLGRLSQHEQYELDYLVDVELIANHLDAFYRAKYRRTH